MPQIRWEWKRAFLRIWKLPTKIFHHIKKENPIHATLADAFLLQGKFLRKYIKRQIKWHSSQRKLFYDIFLTSKSTFQNLYIGVVKGSLMLSKLIKERYDEILNVEIMKNKYQSGQQFFIYLFHSKILPRKQKRKNKNTYIT